jgi:hypothetical protein
METFNFHSTIFHEMILPATLLFPQPANLRFRWNAIGASPVKRRNCQRSVRSGWPAAAAMAWTLTFAARLSCMNRIALATPPGTTRPEIFAGSVVSVAGIVDRSRMGASLGPKAKQHGFWPKYDSTAENGLQWPLPVPILAVIANHGVR